MEIKERWPHANGLRCHATAFVMGNRCHKDCHIENLCGQHWRMAWGHEWKLSNPCSVPGVGDIVWDAYCEGCGAKVSGTNAIPLKSEHERCPSKVLARVEHPIQATSDPQPERAPSCLHPNSNPHGFHRDGRERYRCSECGRTWLQGISRNETKRLSIAEALKEPGSTSRSVSEKLGVSKDTVRKVILVSGKANCLCGREGGHKGWCRYRFEKSEARQKFIKQWTKPKEKVK